MVILGLAFVFELVALIMVNRAPRPGLWPPSVVRHVNAFVETRFPTLQLSPGIATSSPVYLLALAVAWGYFLFIIRLEVVGSRRGLVVAVLRAKEGRKVWAAETYVHAFDVSQDQPPWRRRELR